MFNMLSESTGHVDYSSIGGLGEQIRALRESIELPLMNPELFVRVHFDRRACCSTVRQDGEDLARQGDRQ